MRLMYHQLSCLLRQPRRSRGATSRSRGIEFPARRTWCSKARCDRISGAVYGSCDMDSGLLSAGPKLEACRRESRGATAPKLDGQWARNSGYEFAMQVGGLIMPFLYKNTYLQGKW